MNRTEVYSLIDAERKRQAALWGEAHEWGEGDCSSATLAETVKCAVLNEEIGEVADAFLMLQLAKHGGDSARWVLMRNPDNLRTELVQVAAVAVAWLESIA